MKDWPTGHISTAELQFTAHNDCTVVKLVHEMVPIKYLLPTTEQWVANFWDKVSVINECAAWSWFYAIAARAHLFSIDLWSDCITNIRIYRGAIAA